MGGEVFGDHGFADAVLSDEDDVGGVFEPLESSELFDEIAIDGSGPCPVEVGEGFCGAESSGSEASIEASLGSFLFFPNKQLFDPREILRFVGVGEQSDEPEGFGPFQRSLGQGWSSGS